MKQQLIVFMFLLGFAMAAVADEQKGLYIGAGIGQLNVKADDLDDLGPLVDDFDSDATAFKIFGGWRFSPFFALELDYLDLGTPDDTVNGLNVETSLHGFAPYITGTLPIGPVELFGKVGYLFYDLDVDVNGAEIGALSGSQEDVTYGVGAGITLFDRLHARLEYEYIDVSETIDDADAFWVSAMWRF